MWPGGAQVQGCVCGRCAGAPTVVACRCVRMGPAWGKPRWGLAQGGTSVLRKAECLESLCPRVKGSSWWGGFFYLSDPVRMPPELQGSCKSLAEAGAAGKCSRHTNSVSHAVTVWEKLRTGNLMSLKHHIRAS